MRICAAQHRPVRGDVLANTARHLELIELAASHGCQLLFFPELSLTGYEPGLAKSLVGTIDDHLERFQTRSDMLNLIIGVGLPIAVGSGLQIGMVWFTPNAPRQSYAKQRLHLDEFPYFVPGTEQLVLECAGRKLAPAICYESLEMDHADEAAAAAANVYLASVADGNVARAMVHYPLVAYRHDMTVVMANCVGRCDNFVGVGQSAAWNSRGELLAQMDAQSEGVVVMDLGSGIATVHGLAIN